MKKILGNESGIALLMVSTSIVILSVIMINFTYDSKINKIQAYNIEDKANAKMTAEAGLKFAMIRLRLYKEAFNFLQKNESAKGMANQEVINAIWNFPFIYPIPISDNMNAVQKESLKDFMESSLLEGNLQLTIQNISNRINLNMLRVSLINRSEEGDGAQNGAETAKDPAFSVESQLYKAVDFALRKKSENDPAFANRYMGIDVQRLVDILIAYLSDKDASGKMVDNEFIDAGNSPKHAPMGSFSEIYSLPLWTDDLVALIERDFTIHGGLMIDLNKLTAQTLRLLIPDLMEEDIKEFFNYKNDPANPVFFNTVEQFKNYWVNIANAITVGDFDKIFAKFAAQGLRFGPSPTIFEVISEGRKGRASYKLTAYVVIPAKPQPKPKKQDPNDFDGDGIPNDEDESPGEPVTNTGDGQGGSQQKEQKTQLLEPRIVEIFVN